MKFAFDNFTQISTEIATRY